MIDFKSALTSMENAEKDIVEAEQDIVKAFYDEKNYAEKEREIIKGEHYVWDVEEKPIDVTSL